MRALLAAFPTATFADLIRIRFGPDYPLPENLREHYANYRLENVKRGAARLTHAAQYLAQAGRTLPESGTALEIGSGSGGVLTALARHFTAVAGIDINMVDLLLAKKLIEEQGLTNVTLACACAEALPFQTNAFGYIEALDVIEHVSSQATLLTEAIASWTGRRFLVHFAEPLLPVRAGAACADLGGGFCAPPLARGLR